MESTRVSTSIRSRSSPAVRASLVVIAFAILMSFLASRLSIGQDEAYSLHTTSRGFAYAVQQGIFFEAQAPLYFPVLDVWRLLGHSLFFARSLSIVSSLVTISFAWRFAERYVRSVRPEYVALAFACNPFLVWASVEARPYAAAIAASAALLYHLFRGWLEDEPSRRSQIVFVAVAIIGTYTQYYVATLVAAGAIAVVASGRIDRIKSYIAGAVVVALAIAPVAIILPMQLRAYSASIYAVSRLAGPSVFLVLPDFIFPHAWLGTWVHDLPRNALYAAIALVPTVVAWRSTRTFAPVARTLAVVSLTLCSIFALVIALGHVHVTWPRQTAVVFVPALLTVFALSDGMVPTKRRFAALVFAASYGFLSLVSAFTNYHTFAKSGDWHRVGTYLYAHVAPGDRVAIFDLEASLPLEQYFHTQNLLEIPRPLSFARFDEADYVIHDEAEVAASLGDAARGHGRLWLVENDVCAANAAFYGCAYLDDYLFKHFRNVGRSSFDGSSVRELTTIGNH